MPGSVPNGTLGVNYTQQIIPNGGNSPYSFQITNGSLPSNVNLDEQTGVISGTPTQSGSYMFTITVTDANACAGVQNYTIDVTCPIVSILPALGIPGGIAGVSYQQSLLAVGGTGPYTFAVTGGNLPAGLSLASDGTLSGTLIQSGSYTFVITATDIYGCVGTKTYVLSVSCPTITLSPSSLPSGSVGKSYKNQVGWLALPVKLSASGGTAPYTFQKIGWLSKLPPGLNLDANTGIISGTPTLSGTYFFTIQATDANGCVGSKTYTIKIHKSKNGSPPPDDYIAGPNPWRHRGDPAPDKKRS